MPVDQRPILLAFYAAAVAVGRIVDPRSSLHRAVVQLVCELERALGLPRTHQSRAERRALDTNGATGLH